MFFFIEKKTLKYTFLFLITIIILAMVLIPKYMLTNEDEGEMTKQEIQQVNVGLEKKLVLITHYRVGSDLIETKIENIKSYEEIKEKFPDFEVVEITDEQIRLEREVEDLAPELKGGVYFSLGPDGYLTLYKGTPKENNQVREVIETFFRIDIEKLETGLPKEPVDQLYQGIPIQDLAEFNSVLSTFSEFSLE
ncbi:hypothetical protein BHF71_05725 [Vulcanibacillus modesticaldus]|uniref:Bypass of forespore C C-terminal domain-containing protein n=1 Tax=Vulcanibacillus modesticaldus TaxID=337097 RepID=A0A1D2YWZ8_9BACI|nr:BofC C-terminal domain-containing protein [Vulcanibacillus modesticaldus]OEG00186.1 hypothetical protein BHF71_05725 [Vulcanibacillus modesticaldus]